jgi:hypothetical protein
VLDSYQRGAWSFEKTHDAVSHHLREFPGLVEDFKLLLPESTAEVTSAATNQGEASRDNGSVGVRTLEYLNAIRFVNEVKVSQSDLCCFQEYAANSEEGCSQPSGLRKLLGFAQSTAAGLYNRPGCLPPSNTSLGWSSRSNRRSRHFPAEFSPGYNTTVTMSFDTSHEQNRNTEGWIADVNSYERSLL